MSELKSIYTRGRSGIRPLMGLILHARTFGTWIFILAATTVSLSFCPLFRCFALPLLCLCLCVHASANVPILSWYFTAVQPKDQHEKVLKSEKPVWQNTLWELHYISDYTLGQSFRTHLSYQKKFQQRQFNTQTQTESNDHYLTAKSAARAY